MGRSFFAKERDHESVNDLHDVKGLQFGKNSGFSIFWWIK